jgi:hypothetical protein
MYFESRRIKRWETKKKKKRTIVRERGENKSGATK